MLELVLAFNASGNISYRSRADAIVVLVWRHALACRGRDELKVLLGDRRGSEGIVRHVVGICE